MIPPPDDPDPSKKNNPSPQTERKKKRSSDTKIPDKLRNAIFQTTEQTLRLSVSIQRSSTDKTGSTEMRKEISPFSRYRVQKMIPETSYEDLKFEDEPFSTSVLIPQIEISALSLHSTM